MSLVVPSFYFANQVDNLTGTPAAALPGTNFTANANNADGTSVSILSALSFDVHYLIVTIGGISANGANGQCLLDVLTDPAGGTSWGSFIDDLVCGFTPVPSAGITPIALRYYFPVFIKSGTSVGIRARTLHTSNITSGRCVMHAYGNPSNSDMWWCGSIIESLGINAASSSGTNVTPGNSGAFGSWTSVGTTTSAHYGAIQFGLNGTDGTAASLSYHWQFGYGSTQLPGSPTFYSSTTTNETTTRIGWNSPIWCSIPSGTQMQARATCSGTAETTNVAIYGVY